MSTHATIVLSAAPAGRFLEGILSGTDKPGTVMQLKAATEPVAGKFTWEAYNRSADGEQPQGPLAILLEDALQGLLVTTAGVTATQRRFYVPIPGDELQVLLLNIAGTGDAFAIGDILTVNDGDGKMIATTGSPEMEPFVVAETLTAITADTLCHVFYTGY